MSEKKPGFFRRVFGQGPQGSNPKDEEADRVRAPTAPEADSDRAPDEKKPGASGDESAGPAPAKEDAQKPRKSRIDKDEPPEEEAGPSAPKPRKQKSAELRHSHPRVSESVPEPVGRPEEPKRSWLQRLTGGLSRSSSVLQDNIASIFTKRKLDEITIEELEDALIRADLGSEEAARIAAAIGKGRYAKEILPAEIRRLLAAEVARTLQPVAKPLRLDAHRKPHVALVIGVNGTGKTTTIGKLAHLFVSDGKTVVLAAADTFRAAAIDQLKIWGERAGAEVVATSAGADAAGVAYGAMQRAREVDADLVLIDTAGRLQNKANLMAELSKIIRVIKKQDESAPHSVLLVLDATTGQNGLSQVRAFQEMAGVTGLIMTKLDGTARGGILVRAAAEFGLPVHAIGVGEGIDDLQPFEAEAFANALAGA